MIDICKSLVRTSIKKIEEDKDKENQEIKVLEKNSKKYQELLRNKHLMEKEELDKILKSQQENEDKYHSLKNIAQEIIMKRKDVEEKKKGKKKKREEIDEIENDDDYQDEYVKETSKTPKETARDHHKKKKKRKVKTNDEDDESDPLKNIDIEGIDDRDSINNDIEKLDKNESEKDYEVERKKVRKLKKGNDTELNLKEDDFDFSEN